MKKLFVFFFLLLFSISLSAQLNIKYFLGRGKAALMESDNTEAINRFTRIIEVKPKFAQAYFLRGIAKYNLGDYLGAREDFSQAIHINPFYSEAYHYRGLTKQQLNDFNDAMSDFEEALLMDPTEAMVYVHRGLTYLLNDKFQEARNDFNEAIRIDPNLPSAYMNRAIAFLELKDTAAALTDLNKSIKLHPYNNEAFRRRGLVFYLQGNYRFSIEDYNRALRLDPGNSLVVYQRALAKYKKGDYEGALEDYNTVITLEPKNALAIYNRGLLKSEIGRYNDAITDYDRVSQLNPDNVLVYYNRAGVKIEIGDLEGALKDYDKAINIFPDFATAYINRSIVKQKLGQEKQAYFDRQQAEKIITEYKKTHNDTTYEAFRDTSRNLAQLVDFNSEFNNDFTRDDLQNTEVNITLKNNYIIAPAPKDFNPENVRFISALFEAEKQAGNDWKWIPESWENDSLNLLFIPQSPDSLTYSNTEYERYSYAIAQSLSNNFYKGIKALDNRNINWERYFLLGTIKAQMKEHMGSMDDFNTQIRLNTDIGTISNTTADGNSVDYSDAIVDLTKSIELNPNFSLAYFNRGNLHCKERSFKKGIDDYTEAIKIDQLPEAYYNRGLTLIFLKETEKGCLDISKAGEMGIEEAYNVIKRFCVDE